MGTDNDKVHVNFWLDKHEHDKLKNRVREILFEKGKDYSIAEHMRKLIEIDDKKILQNVEITVRALHKLLSMRIKDKEPKITDADIVNSLENLLRYLKEV